MCAWHPYHTTSYHLQLDLFSRLYHKTKKTSGHKMGCSLQPKEGQMYSPWRRCTISLKISHPFSTTCDSQSWVILHYCWPAILPSMLTILLSLLSLITESEKHQAIKKSWDTFCKWTLNKTLYTVRLSTSNCLGFCIMYYYCIKTVVFESKSGFHQLYLKLYLNIYMD